ncbi:hypothetical protein ACFYVW_32810 [Streptomyces tendae]|uniref:hypothetical protein n=1 Tax=Streptomyces tendae TaxID=1932 RepID=UPI00369F7B54
MSGTASTVPRRGSSSATAPRTVRIVPPIRASGAPALPTPVPDGAPQGFEPR